MKAVILAGGMGTRMRPLTYVIPKPLLPIGGKPLLEHTFQYLKEYGITEVILCVAYLKRRIKDHFKDGKDLGIHIEYAEADMPLGTAGQLKTAEKFISEQFIQMNGDILSTLNLNKLRKFHAKNGAIGTIALKKFEVKVPYGYLEVDANSLVQKFEEKPTLSLLANAGIYVLEPDIFQSIPSKTVVSIEQDVFPKLLNTNVKLAGYYEDAYWADVGTISDFERVDKELLSKFYQETSESNP